MEDEKDIKTVPVVNVVCRCGNVLTEGLEPHYPDKPFVLVCHRCYLNHKFEWRDREPVMTLRYYFPDD
ncbi:MAG: hypothetical protein HYU86_10725 [Chloroflexi bacterium]|nr:hypothetical protein [Chloroflexota bacterium]